MRFGVMLIKVILASWSHKALGSVPMLVQMKVLGSTPIQGSANLR